MEVSIVDFLSKILSRLDDLERKIDRLSLSQPINNHSMPPKQNVVGIDPLKLKDEIKAMRDNAFNQTDIKDFITNAKAQIPNTSINSEFPGTFDNSIGGTGSVGLPGLMNAAAIGIKKMQGSAPPLLNKEEVSTSTDDSTAEDK